MDCQHESVKSLIERYLAHSKSNPDEIAYAEDFTNRRYTINDFIALASDIQSYLISAGIKENDIVVIKLGRTIEHMASRLAVIATGAVCLPIEPDIPDERFDNMTAGLDIKMVLDRTVFPLPKKDTELIIDDIDDNEPCFIIFTSGSTGRPKGILHPRKTILHIADYMRSFRIKWPGEMRVGTITNVSFIISWTDFIFQLDRYSTNYLFDDRVRGDINTFREKINDLEISILVCNPNYYRMLGPDTCLELVVLGGERTGAFEEERTILDCYGASEAICAYRILSKGSEIDSLITVPDGRLYIEDENGNEASEGELIYRGPGIMIGYIGDKNGDGPLGIYRTGDIAKRTENGYIIIGRKDSMIKINGQRVEPAETESIMCQIPGVSIAAVKSFDDCGNYLCGYYVSDYIDETEIRKILSSKLNPYQIPKYLKRMDSLPLNPNGKIDRPSLQSLRSSEGCTEAPVTKTEVMICKAFADALNLHNVGLDDDFIEFGGDSMSVMRLIASFDSMKENKDITLRPQDIMLLRTPRAISENIRRATEFECRYDLTTGGPAPDSVREGYILTTAFNERFFTLPVLISMDSWKDYSDAELLVKGLIKMFPVLSMRVEDRNGKLWMMFDRQPEFIRMEKDPKSIRIEDVSEYIPDRDVATRFIICKFNGKISVLISLSHLVFDGKSAAPMIGSILSGRKSPDIGLIYQGAYDESLKGTPAYETSRQLIERYLRPVFSDTIPELPKYDIASDGRLFVPMDVSAKAVTDFAKECGVTITSLLTVAFGIAKAKFTGSYESTFSLVTGGRTAPGTDDSVGMFTKIVPVHISKKDMGTKEYIRYCSSEIAELIAHDEFPVCDMFPQMYPDFGFLFQYSDFMTGGSIPGIEAELLPGGAWVNNTTMSVVPNGDILILRLKYSTRYREEDIAELLCSFDEILERMMRTEKAGELFDL